MQPQYLRLIVPLLLALSAAVASGGLLDGESKSGGASIGVRTDDGNPFYYVECSVGISIDYGFGAGCERKWKPLFFACLAGGGVLAALVLSCCCCCCCAPCRRKQAPPATCYPAAQTTNVFLISSEAPNPVSYPPSKYDIQMLHA